MLQTPARREATSELSYSGQLFKLAGVVGHWLSSEKSVLHIRRADNCQVKGKRALLHKQLNYGDVARKIQKLAKNQSVLSANSARGIRAAR